MKDNRKPIGVFIKDTHLSQKSLKINQSIFKQAIDLCKKLKTPLFHAGDVFTARASQPLEMLNAFRDILSNLEDNNIYMHIIAGNHDKVNQEDERSYISAFEKHPNIKLYSKQETVDFGDIVIHFMPYFLENGSYSERLETLKPIKDKYNICLTHISVNGVKNNDGSEVENGIGKKAFDKFDLTMIAHYHDESWIGKKIWYYPGTYQANFGETTKKGFIILYNDNTFEFIQSVFPQFIKVKLNITDQKAIKQAEKELKNSPHNVRFVFEGEEAELKNVDKEKYSALGIDVIFNKDSATPLNNEGLVERASSISFDRSNVQSAFETFCQTKHIEDNSIGLEYLKKI